MSAEITAVDSMFYSRTMDGGIPWHGLGTPVDGNLVGWMARETSGLNWQVRTQHVYIRDLNAAERTAVEVPGVRAVVRSDTGQPLDGVTVSEKYQAIQNFDVFETFDAAVRSVLGEQPMWHTAGSLKGGREVFALAEIPGDWYVAGGKHRRFVLGTAGHDAEHTARWLPTDVTVVCANTLGAALSGFKGRTDTFSVTHRGDVQAKMAKVTDAFKAQFQAFDDFKVRMETLAGVSMTRDESRDFVAAVLLNGRTKDDGTPDTLGPRDTNALDAILRLSTQGRGAETWGGTAYGVLQATSDYVDHERMQDATPERRFYYQTDGAGSRLKQRMEATLVREYAAATGGAILDSILS